jgi:site-specific DNA-methyltransferase (adenine-specific)
VIDLLLGDCLVEMRGIADGSIDCVITDPPYGKRFHDGGLAGRPAKKWANPNPAKFAGQTITGDSKPDTRVVTEIARLLRPGGAAYVFSQWMVESAWKDALKASGLTVRNRLIWVKPMHGMGDTKTTFGPQHESILYATRGRHELKGRRDGDVWVQPFGAEGCFAGRKGKLHPNQKPLGLIEWLIAKSSDEGDTVLDPFAGSGTTLIACLNTNRHGIGIESDPI